MKICLRIYLHREVERVKVKVNIAVCIEGGNCEIGDESRHHLTREAAQDLRNKVNYD